MKHLDILKKYHEMDWNDPNLDITDITIEVLELYPDEFKAFITLAELANYIDVQDDGWAWINPKTGKVID